MSSYFRVHRIVALIVLIAAAVWIGTGEFAAVGSKNADAEGSAAEAAAAEPASAEQVKKNRAVSGLVPVFVDHSRKIKLSGSTQPD